MIGRRLGRYVIEGVLGEGGMGLVYRAHDTVLGRRVALKVLLGAPTEIEAESGERELRLVREAQAAAALNHPNAVAIYDVGEVDGVAFIALELVEGRTLRRYIGGREPALAQRIRWLVDVAAALAAAHHEGLVHRDIKPENVMIRVDGQVKVLDFGIARRFQPQRAPVSGSLPAIPATLTAAGTVVGTPQYMAPEQMFDEPLDGRADQFAWGVLAYEVLTGRLPWSGTSWAAMVKQLSSPHDPIRAVNPEVPEIVALIVERALCKRREDRHDTMAEIVEGLSPFADVARAVMGSAHSVVSEDALTAEAPPPASSAPTQLAPIAVTTTLGSRSLAAASVPPPSRESAEPPGIGDQVTRSADVAPPRRKRGLVIAVPLLVLIAAIAVVVHRAAKPSIPDVSATAPAAPIATALTALPLPPGLPEAVAAYKSGLAALRAGEDLDDFERAIALDPSIGAAWVQLVVDASESSVDEAARERYHRAEKLASTMTERDQALLSAIAPVVIEQPSNWAESSRRFRAAVERFPGDAQLWYELGWTTTNAAGIQPSVPATLRAIELDPGYGSAFEAYAQNLAYLGRTDEAHQTIARCMKAAPASLSCRRTLHFLLVQEGACAADEALARQMIAASSASTLGYAALAGALASRGRSAATVREALKQRWAATSPSLRAAVTLRDTIAADVVAGDFTGAEAAARELGVLAEPSRRETDHGVAARWLAEILVETGRSPEAGRVAAQYLDRRDAWEPEPRAEDFAMAADATPLLLSLALRSGAISPQSFAERRAEWVRAWDAKVAVDMKNYVWMHGFAAPVTTADEAREALAALPKYLPIPAFRPMTLADTAVGTTLLLGGRGDDALPWLEGATKSCHALDFPFEHTRAHLALGQAREAKGDAKGACAAYQVVVDRWGAARPPSVTAEKASARRKALSCAR